MSVQIFLPATTRVIRRGRIGSAHLHDPPRGTFTLLAQPNAGDTFGITSTISLVAGVNFVNGATILETVQNIVNAINDLDAGMVGIVNVINEQNIVYIQNDSLANTLTITYTGSADIIPSGPLGSNVSLEPNQMGPYVYDTSQPFSVAAVATTLTQDVNSSTGRVVLVNSSAGFPNQTGYIVFDYGGQTQELAQYIATPSADSILLSPINNLAYDHNAGQSVMLIQSKSPVVIPSSGLGFEFFITDVISGRIYAQQLIEQVVAAGISLVFTVLYPNSVGLGKSDTPYDEIVWVYGPDAVSVQYPINDLGGT
jgi:hypothetical protein